jgi:hypothetical protein
VGFTGAQGSELRFIELAYAREPAATRRVARTFADGHKTPGGRGTLVGRGMLDGRLNA